MAAVSLCHGDPGPFLGNPSGDTSCWLCVSGQEHILSELQLLELRFLEFFQIWPWCRYKLVGLVAKSCPTLATPWTVAHQAPLSVDFPGKNTGVGCHFLFQGIFLTQELNSGLPLQADSLLTEWPGCHKIGDSITMNNHMWTIGPDCESSELGLVLWIGPIRTALQRRWGFSWHGEGLRGEEVGKARLFS